MGGDIKVKSQHFSGIDIQAGSNAQKHQVRSGETLRSIAAMYFGSSDFWYIVADANGLANSPDDILSGGQTLDIPSKANTNNDFGNLQPMNLAEALGDTTPNLPYVPPPSEVGCNVIASLVMVVIAVVVTSVTAGAATALGPVLSAALGGAAGSAASQGVGMGMGVVDKFSWNQVALAAVGGAISGGMNEALGVGAKVDILGSHSGKLLTTVQKTTQGGTQIALSNVGRAVSAAASSIGSAGANKVITGHSGFSWANVASAAVTASLGGRLPGETTTGLNLIDDFVGGVGRSAVGYGVNRAFGGDRSWNGRDVVVDAFGNAIGNSIVGKLQQTERDKKLAEQKENQRLSNMVNWDEAFAVASGDYMELNGELVPTSSLSVNNNLVQDDSFARFQNGDYPAFDFAGLDVSLDDSISKRLNIQSYDGIAAPSDLSLLEKMGSIYHDNWFYSGKDKIFGSNLMDNIARTALIGGDLLFTGINDMESLYQDGIQNLFFGGDALTERVDNLISTGYLADGQELSYREAKTLSQELFVRGIDDFQLSIDGTQVGTIGGVATPFPLDSTKVFGNLSPNKITGMVNYDRYDFWDVTPNGTYTLDQQLPSFKPNDNLWGHSKTLFKQALTYGRNQLNHIAEAQHGSNISEYTINFRYSNKD